MLHVGSRCSFGIEWDAGGKGIFCCRRQNISSTVLLSFMQYPHGGTPRNLQGSPQIGNSSQQPILSTKLQLRKPLIPADDAKYDKTMVTGVTSIVWCRVRCLVMPLYIHYDVRRNPIATMKSPIIGCVRHACRNTFGSCQILRLIHGCSQAFKD